MSNTISIHFPGIKIVQTDNVWDLNPESVIAHQPFDPITKENKERIYVSCRALVVKISCHNIIMFGAVNWYEYFEIPRA